MVGRFQKELRVQQGSTQDRQDADQARRRWIGHVDRYDEAGVHGWAADADALDRVVRVEMVDATGRRVAQVAADVFRADLVENGIGQGRHGFFMPIPDGIKPFAPIHVRFSDCRVLLQGGVIDLDAETMMLSSPMPEGYVSLMRNLAFEVEEAAHALVALA